MKLHKTSKKGSIWYRPSGSNCVRGDPKIFQICIFIVILRKAKFKQNNQINAFLLSRFSRQKVQSEIFSVFKFMFCKIAYWRQWKM